MSGCVYLRGDGHAAMINLDSSGIYLWLLTLYRHCDVNMASAWECSRNDAFEGLAVLLAAAGVGLFNAGRPDLLVAAALLMTFSRSAWRILRRARTEPGAGSAA